MATVGFVFSAGGTHGAFEVGAAKYLYEMGIQPAVLAGTSGGSLNAVKLAEGDSDASTAIQQLEQSWIELQQNSDMYAEQPWLGQVSKQAASLFRSATGLTSDLTQPPPIALTVWWAIFPPFRLIKIAADYISASGDCLQLAADLKTGLAQPALYDLTPLRERLRRQIDPAKIANSGIKLVMTTVSLETGDTHYINQNGQMTSADGMPIQIDLVEGVIASASIPCVFPPQSLGGDSCVDGGIRHFLPVEAAVSAGADELYLLYAYPAEVDRLRRADVSNIVQIGERSLTEIVTNQIQEFEASPPPSGWGVPVNRVQPRLDLPSSLLVDPGIISITIDYGYMCAFDAVSADAYPSGWAEIGRDLADSITQLRLQCWQAEFAVQNFSINANSTASINALRELKTRVMQAAEARRDVGGALPPNPESWWMRYERHNIELANLNPWAIFRYLDGDGNPRIAAPAVPPPEPTQLKIVLNVSGHVSGRVELGATLDVIVIAIDPDAVDLASSPLPGTVNTNAGPI